MRKNAYDITVDGKTLKGFEFISGPMAAISIPQPPRQPEEFIESCFEGGATPIIAPRDPELSLYLDEIKKIKKRMSDCYIGANIFAPWWIAPGFIEKIPKLGKYKPDFVDINAIELNFAEIMPLLKKIELPLYIGINQPISVYTFKKYMFQKEYSYLIDRIKEGKIKFYLPQSHGGGHLPILKKEQENTNWTEGLLDEVLAIGKEIDTTIPFIVEKGMLTVDDFVNVIRKYSSYPGFSGVRFASVLELTKESGLNEKSKELLTDVVKNKRTDMMIPIRSVIGGSKSANKKTVRGGVISYVVATELARKINEVQCGEEDFPRFSRKYSMDALRTQIQTAKKAKRKNICKKCIIKCPKEYCELGGAFESVENNGDLNVSLIHVTPKIFDIDPAYIGASATFVISDLIEKVLGHFK